MTVMMMVLGSGRGLFGDWSGFDILVGTIGGALILLFGGLMLITGRKLAAQEATPPFKR